MNALDVFVAGTPIPQGSKRHVGHGVMREENAVRLGPWRDQLAWALLAVRRGRPPLDGPVEVTLTFRLQAPQRRAFWWQRIGPWVACRPDVDKLARAVLDAMTVAGVVADDGQVALLHASKVYAEGPTGVDIRARQLLDAPT